VAHRELAARQQLHDRSRHLHSRADAHLADGARGTQYIAQAPYQGGAGGGYVYAVDRQAANNANGVALQNDRALGKTIWDFNLEQQAEICRHYYMRRQVLGLPYADWQPYIDDIQGVNTMPLKSWVREPALLPWA
jgi:hypothetical protein